MKVYHYHKRTFEYQGETNAKLDPEETKLQGKEIYRCPALATFKAPPARPEGHALKFVNNEWVLEEIIVSEETLAQKTSKINEQVKEKIAEQYDIYDELKMLNMVLTNPNDPEYLTYKQYRQDCLDWGQDEKAKL